MPKRAKPIPGPHRELASLPTGSCPVRPHPYCRDPDHEMSNHGHKERSNPAKSGATAARTEATPANTRATKAAGTGDGPTMNQAPHAKEAHLDTTSLLFQGLRELQKVHDNKKNRGESSTMIIEEDWFHKHAKLIRQAWELSKKLLEPGAQPDVQSALNWWAKN